MSTIAANTNTMKSLTWTTFVSLGRNLSRGDFSPDACGAVYWAASPVAYGSSCGDCHSWLFLNTPIKPRKHLFYGPACEDLQHQDNYESSERLIHGAPPLLARNLSPAVRLRPPLRPGRTRAAVSTLRGIR